MSKWWYCVDCETEDVSDVLVSGHLFLSKPDVDYSQ